MISLKALASELDVAPHFQASGKVVAVRGPLLLARLPQVALGDLCYIRMNDGTRMPAQVVAFEEDVVSLAPFDYVEGVSPGAEVTNSGTTPQLEIPDDAVGCVLDALGRPLSGSATFDPGAQKRRMKILQAPPHPLSRSPIKNALTTGVASIDSLCTIGYGQRVGLFAGAGGGKSTLLGMISRNADVDLSVIALVGERGREVNEFLHESLGPEGLKKAIVVVATSDESPARRRLAALTATAIAEHHRDKGKRVLLLVDSLTRTARAIREVSLAAGEVPVRQGYTSSVYTELPKLLERAGNNDRGSITAIYTVLTAGENDIDPLGEEVKSILDGHIQLDSRVANEGVRPAIDHTVSVSRVLPALHEQEQISNIQLLQRALAKLKKDKDVLLFGGTPDAELKAALAIEQELKDLLNQKPHEYIDAHETRAKVKALAEHYQQLLEQFRDAAAADFA